MYPTLCFSAFMLASCLTTPANDAAHPGKLSTPSAPPSSTFDPFPVPKEGISIKIGAEGDPRLDVVLNEFSRVTGQTLLIGKEVKQLLQNSSTGLSRSIEVPPQEVYPIVETILAQHDFMLILLSDREPRLLGVVSLNMNVRGGLKQDAISVPAEQISAWARHPAFLVTTVLDLPNTDVRTLSNSLRTMFTDQNTQQIIPIGNSNSLMITATGTMAANLASFMRTTDEIARRDAEQQKAAPPRPAPKDLPTRDSAPKDSTGKDAPPK